MQLILTFSVFTLALVLSSDGVAASQDKNSTVMFKPKVSGLRGTKHNTTRLLTEEYGGVVEIVTLARFNNVAGGWYQRVFDFGNGAGKDNVWLGQVGNSKDMAFEIWADGSCARCVAPGAIIQGELATWKAGVEWNGLQWLEKNGHRICSIQGKIPKNVDRVNELLGQSNWAADTPLKGAVIGIDVTYGGEIRDGGLLNQPSQIKGEFSIAVDARFDAPQGGHWQRVFDFGNGAGKDNVWLGQLANTNDMVFEIWRNGVFKRLIAPKAIVTGKLATWEVGGRRCEWSDVDE